MKGNEGKILLGSFVIAILLVAASFKFFYLEDKAKADQLQNEINQKNDRLNELNQKNANRALYDSGIDESGKIIDTVLSIYGPGNSPEKSIMMIVKMCNMTGVTVSDIAFLDSTNVYSSETKNEGEEPAVQIFQGGLQLKLLSGYTQLKKVMDFINAYPERMNVENFDVEFDAETGRLASAIKVNLFSVKDDKHQYVEPVIEDIDLGNANIFKTIEEETPIEGEEPIEGADENQNTEAPVLEGYVLTPDEE
jgi:hypothetical protein